MDLIQRPQATWAHLLGQYVALTKPRIVMLTAFCAVIGMVLAEPGMVPWRILVFGTLGISLLAGAGFTFNCLVERGIDARMARTRGRPAARGEVSVSGAAAFALLLAGAGAWLLLAFVNPLTMWLTLATFVGYALVYTLVLKPATPQNIVIGGASGAMPPLLGWAAVANDVTAVAGNATSPKKILLPAVVLTDPLFNQKRTTVAFDVPEAVAPLVEVNLIWT
jgi:protoheme IX farnesyltransferase